MSDLVCAMLEPTAEEWKVLRAIGLAASRAQGDPTLNEIAQAMEPQSSAPAVHRILQKLVLKGWISHLPRRSRGIRLMRPLPEEEDG